MESKFFHIGAVVNLVRKPSWLDEFRLKYDEFYNFHITLKTVTNLEGDYGLLKRDLGDLVKKYKPLKIVFNKLVINNTSKGGCIMIEAEENADLTNLQKEVSNTLSKYGDHPTKEYEGWEKNFKPHQTIARHLTPEQLEEAKKEIGKDLVCEGLINNVELAVANETSFEGWANGEITNFNLK